jgi:hypothetical protein
MIVSSIRDGIPEPLVAVLRSALDAEQAAAGYHRRAAFRTTRYLIGGAIAIGVPPAAIAVVTGTTESSVRNRATSGGIVSPAEFAKLAHLSNAEIETWASSGLLPALASDAIGTTGYPTEALLRALLSPTRHERAAFTSPAGNNQDVLAS